MSTKSSLFFSHDKDYVHIYQEVFDDEKIYIEKVVTSEQKAELTLLEVGILSRCFDLHELERQCNLTDEEIKAHTDSLVLEYIQKPNAFTSIWLNNLCGNDAQTLEERQTGAFENYKKKQLELISLREKILTAKVSKHYFGLESVKSSSH